MKGSIFLLLVVTFVSMSSLSIPAFAKDAQSSDTVKVAGYTRKDGKKVAGYDRKVTPKKSATDDTISVPGYTKKDGTVVKGYTRKKTTKSDSK